MPRYAAGINIENFQGGGRLVTQRPAQWGSASRLLSTLLVQSGPMAHSQLTARYGQDSTLHGAGLEGKCYCMYSTYPLSCQPMSDTGRIIVTVVETVESGIAG